MLKKTLIDELYTLDKEGIKAANSILRQRWKELNVVDSSKYKFYIGQEVSFKGKSVGIFGGMQTGKIIKINPKSIKVKTETAVWNVSPNLVITHIEDSV